MASTMPILTDEQFEIWAGEIRVGLVHTAMRRLRNADAAEDMASEAIVAAWLAHRKSPLLMQDKKQLAAYLNRSLVNEITSKYAPPPNWKSRQIPGGKHLELETLPERLPVGKNILWCAAKDDTCAEALEAIEPDDVLTREAIWRKRLCEAMAQAKLTDRQQQAIEGILAGETDRETGARVGRTASSVRAGRCDAIRKIKDAEENARGDARKAA